MSGPRQAVDGKDREVDASGWLPVQNIRHGRFDAKLVDQTRRNRARRGVDLAKDTTFGIRKTGLTECRRADARYRRRYH